MTRYLFLFIALAVGLNAREIKNARFGFKVVFPDEPGWSTVAHKSPSPESQSWSAESEAARLVFIFTALATPESEAKSTFQERAAAWEKGMMTHFTRKISGRFARLAGHDAYELVAVVEDEQMKVYYSIWMMPVGKFTFGVTIMADNQAKLGGEAAGAFLDSIEITE